MTSDTQDVGVLVVLDGRSRAPLPDPGMFWWVETGAVLLRRTDPAGAVATAALIEVVADGLVGGQAPDARADLLTAAGLPGTTVRVLTWADPAAQALPGLAAALDSWVAAVSGLRAAGPVPSSAGVLVSAQHSVQVGDGDALRAPGPGFLAVVQGTVRSGDGRAAGAGELLACEPGTPLVASGATQVRFSTGAELVVAARDGGPGLASVGPALAALAATADATGARLREDRTQLQQRRDASRIRTHRRLSASATDLVRLVDQSRVIGPTPGGDALENCLAALGAPAEVLAAARRAPVADRPADPTEGVEAMLGLGLRARRVRLEPGWQRHDSGDLLGFVAGTAAGDPGGLERSGAVRPVLLRRTRRGYRVDDPANPSTRVPTASVPLLPLAYEIYPDLRREGRDRRGRSRSSEVLGVRDLLSRGLRLVTGDLLTVLAAAAAAGLLGLATPALTTQIVGHVLPTNDRTLLAQAAVALVVAAVAVGAFVATQSSAVDRLGQRLQYRWQTWVLDRLLRLPATFFRAHTPAELAARILDLDYVRTSVTSVVVGPVLGLLFGGFGVALMFALAPALATVSLAVLAVVAVGCAALAWRQSRAAGAVADAERREQNALVAAMTGITKIRVAQAESRAYAQRVDALVDRSRRQLRLETSTTALAVISAALPVTATAVLWTAAGGQLARGAESLGAGAFLGFTAAFATVLGAVFGVTTHARSLVEAAPRVTALRPILAARPEDARRGADPGELRGAVEVAGVSFAYPGGPEILRDLTLRVEPGQLLAVVGPSGSGKSTLLRLLLGFETPTAGEIFYDDRDLAGLDVAAVRRQLGVVMQNDRLFGGEVSRAILGSSTAGPATAWRAAELAGVAEDIRRMPMGMHTLVDARGSTISGGQRQRIAIARALVGNPRVLLFDEATSALDNRTQEAVTSSLAGLSATRIVIAHRLSTIRRADLVVVLDHGRIVESGTVDELTALGGTFAALARRQQLSPQEGP